MSTATMQCPAVRPSAPVSRLEAWMDRAERAEKENDALRVQVQELAERNKKLHRAWQQLVGAR